MRLLLDTHILLWALNDDPRLTAAMRERLGAADTLIVSAVSIWEISIKRASGKLLVRGDVMETARRAGCRPLPVTWAHGDAAGRLPLHHADPFDRLLIAQARTEDLTLISADRQFRAYDVALA